MKQFVLIALVLTPSTERPFVATLPNTGTDLTTTATLPTQPVLPIAIGEVSTADMLAKVEIVLTLFLNVF